MWRATFVKKLFICRSFEGWIEGAEKKIVEGYPSPNNMEEATTMVNNCKVTKLTTDDSILGLETGRANKTTMVNNYKVPRLRMKTCRGAIILERN